MFNVRFMDGVVGLQELAKHGNLSVPCPADAIAGAELMLRDGFQIGNGMQVLVGAKHVIPRSVVTGVLSAVRNRILDLALELEQIPPTFVARAEPAVAQQRSKS